MPDLVGDLEDRFSRDAAHQYKQDYFHAIISLKMHENRHKQKYQLMLILGVRGMPYSLQSFRFYM